MVIFYTKLCFQKMMLWINILREYAGKKASVCTVSQKTFPNKSILAEQLILHTSVKLCVTYVVKHLVRKVI